MKTATFAAVVLLALSACAGSPSGGSNGVPAIPAHAMAQQTKIAGQYSGTTVDRRLGKGRATVRLSADGATIGGWIGSKFSSGKVVQAVSLRLASNGAMSGTSTAMVSGNACTFSVKALYDTRALTLNGGYKSIHGCGTESGRFQTKQACYYPNLAMKRPNGTLPKPC